MTGSRRTRRAFLGGLGAAALAGAAGCTAAIDTRAASGPTPTATTEEDPTEATATATTPSTSRYTQVFRETVGSVVQVQTVRAPRGGQGSGFVYDEDGLVVTNQHVVARADRVDLRFAEGGWRAAEVVGTDVYTDLAVLRPADPPAYAEPLPLVDGPPAIGAEVVAIGSPFGLERSLSAGVVSGVHRAIPTAGGFSIPDAVQTDAAVNPGNSGGPLVMLDGEAVGVIRSGGGDNIGFAISAALVRLVAPALAARGRYRHAYLGVGVLDVDPTVAEANGLDRATGVLVETVIEGGPADGVLRGSGDTRTVDGLEVPVGGDVIVAMDGTPIPTSGALGRYLALRTRPDETVPVEVIRDGERTTVDLTLGTRPPPGG